MWRPVVFADSARKVISSLTPDKMNTSAPHVAAPSLLIKVSAIISRDGGGGGGGGGGVRF